MTSNIKDIRIRGQFLMLGELKELVRPDNESNERR